MPAAITCWLAIITLGEGWHNNHHHYPASVRQGFYWWEFDITFYLLKLMSFCRTDLGLETGAGGGARRSGQAHLNALCDRHRPCLARLAPRPWRSSKSPVGDGGWLESPDDLAPYLSDFRRLYHGATPLVLLPRSAERSRAGSCAICNRDEVAVVPHGGNTSYCGGATPDESGSQIVLSMQRLNRVRHIDAANYSMIVEVGCTLAGAQAAAREAERLFPLSLGSEGTAQIGGNLSTNAGGTAVLRYGMMRDLVLGLEVVLADGRVLSALKSLRKDNTGYDVKSLFIGAEGTLGIITAASLKLFPPSADTATALVGIDSPQHALAICWLVCAPQQAIS